MSPFFFAFHEFFIQDRFLELSLPLGRRFDIMPVWTGSTITGDKMATRDTATNPDRAEKVEGVLERIIFSHDDHDFVVATLNILGRSEPITIVGRLAQPHPGETLVLSGSWEFNRNFGEQFKFTHAETKAPSTVRGIEKYLSSNLIKGIGPEMARRITAKFGEQTLEIIEKTPEKLLGVSGIGKARAAKISQAFLEQQEIRDVMLFLQTHGVSSTYAYRIFKRYQKRSIDVVRNNPYVLATDIRGIGFKSADKIAGSLGIDLKSPLRAKAGLIHTLDVAQSEGHTYLPHPNLIEKARALLSVDSTTLEKALSDLSSNRDVVMEDGRVYLSLMARVENSVATRVKDLLISPSMLPRIKMDSAIDWVEKRSTISLSEAQKLAIRTALTSKLLIITGGPGTGKTTLLKSLIQILEAKKLRTLLGAPTGRAAKRLSESSGKEAKTVHRLLEYSPSEGGFQRTAANPLEADVVIIDEVSMMDIVLANHLLGAIDPMSSLVLVGDADQLPSVGPGNFLMDLLDSGEVPVVRLDTVFRQAQQSEIVTNAHRVNAGLLPMRNSSERALSDFYLIEKDEPEDMLRLVREMVSRRIPNAFQFNPADDIQILTPMNRGQIGTENLNSELRELLNSEGKPIRGGRFKVGDRVMQTRNNYDKEVFNGDIGSIISYDENWNEVIVDFDSRSVQYHVNELDELSLAYAVTIHKSQGSEYPCVIIPLSTQHFVMLRRNLLYTAMTRGKQLVILIANPKALEIAVSEKNAERRFTGLAEKLRVVTTPANPTSYLLK